MFLRIALFVRGVVRVIMLDMVDVYLRGRIVRLIEVVELVFL